MPWKTSKSFDLSPKKEIAGGKLDQLPLMNSTEPSGTSTPPDSGSISNPSKDSHHERKVTQNVDSRSPQTPKRVGQHSPERLHVTTVKVESPNSTTADLGSGQVSTSTPDQSPSISYERNKSVRIILGDQQVSYEQHNACRKNNRLSSVSSREAEAAVDKREIDAHLSNCTKSANSVVLTTNEGKSWSVGIPQPDHESKARCDRGSKIVNSWKACNGSLKEYYQDEVPSLEDCQRSTSTLVTTKSSKFSSSAESQRGFVSLACGVGIVAGAAVCLRLPGLLISYGAGNFLSAYLLSLLLIAVPLAYLESGLGQFSNSSVIGIWSLVPLARGIGWSAVIGCLYWGAATVGMASPWLHYIVAQFNPSLLQLKGDGCSQNAFNASSFDSTSYYRYCVYNLTSTDVLQYNFGLTWALPAGLIVILTLASISVAGGPVLLGSVSGVSAVFALLGYSVQLILGVAEMAKDDKRYINATAQLILDFVIPNLEVLFAPQVWMAAASQALLSLGPGIGLLLNHSASNIFRFPLKRHLWFLTVITLMMTLIVSVTTLMHLAVYGYVQSNKLDSNLTQILHMEASLRDAATKDLEQFFKKDCVINSYKYSSTRAACDQIDLGISEGFPFVASSRLLSITSTDRILLNVANLVVNLGFLGAGICTACACLHVGVVAAREAKSIPPAGAAVLLMILLSLLAAPMATQAGPSLLHLLDFYVILPGLLWSPLASSLSLALFHGVKKIRKDLTFMLENQVCFLWLPLWAFVLPSLLLGLTAWFFVIEWEEFGVMGGNTWKAIIVWLLRGGLLLPIPIAAIVVVKSQLAYGFKDKILSSLQSSREWGEWGPQDPIEHHNWRQWREDETRSYASLDRRLAANARPLTYTHSTLSSTGSSTLTRIRAKYRNGNAPSML